MMGKNFFFKECIYVCLSHYAVEHKLIQHCKSTMLQLKIDLKMQPYVESQYVMFIGRIDAEAEAPVFWPFNAKRWLIGKDPDAGKDWRRKRRGWQKMRWFSDITDSMHMNLSKLRQIVKDREAWHAAVHGVTKSQTWLSDWKKSQEREPIGYIYIYRKRFSTENWLMQLLRWPSPKLQCWLGGSRPRRAGGADEVQRQFCWRILLAWGGLSFWST